MTTPPTYVLDANVLIQAARTYYAFDIGPRFWEALVEHATNRRILSIDLIHQEIIKGKDDLARWVKNDFHYWFESTQNDNNVFLRYRKIIDWVQRNPQFKQEAKRDFANGADGWLIAYTWVRGYVVVTLEKHNPEIKRKVPIPNVCQQFNIPYTDTFSMLRDLGVRLC